MVATGFLVATLLAALAQAFPILETRQLAVSTLSATEVSGFKPYSFYAAAAYCKPTANLAWTCGNNCKANPTFKPIASGGNGDSTQFWYVGFDPTLNTVIVGHQGTDTSKLLPILTDLNFALAKLDSALFPGISSSVKVHNGFGAEQAKTAKSILAAVQTAISTYSATKVTVVGHSLGAAISLIDAVYLRLQLPTTVTVATVGYGMPRVGNKEFADFVDARIQSVVHVNNKEDLVPILPGRFAGFHHPNGEKHIVESNAWVNCPGQDNTNSQCTVGTVKNIFVGDADDHLGPYDGVNMTCDA